MCNNNYNTNLFHPRRNNFQNNRNFSIFFVEQREGTAEIRLTVNQETLEFIKAKGGGEGTRNNTQFWPRINGE